jgi:threonyl-tRNA synthetase
MIHRVVLGSIERFIAVLIEHYAGAFPFWLSPVQVKVLTITSAQDDYGRQVAHALRAKGYRVEEDFRNEKIGFKIRRLSCESAFMAILGAGNRPEARSARRREQGDIGAFARRVSGYSMNRGSMR